jgi:hypothetical protein
MESHPPTAETDPLGARYREYRPSGVSTGAGFIFGVLLIVAGALVAGFAWYNALSERFDLPLNVQRGWSWLAVGGFTFLGGVLFFIGWMFARASHAATSYSCELRTKGFRECSGGNCEEVLWADVQLIRKVTYVQRLSGRPQLPIVHCKVILKSAKEYDFGRIPIKGMSEFVKILYEVARQNSIPWEATEEPLL